MSHAGPCNCCRWSDVQELRNTSEYTSWSRLRFVGPYTLQLDKEQVRGSYSAGHEPAEEAEPRQTSGRPMRASACSGGGPGRGQKWAQYLSASVSEGGGLRAR